MEEDDSEQRLNGGLDGTGNGVSERTRVLNLHENGDVDEPSGETSGDDAHPSGKVEIERLEGIQD